MTVADKIIFPWGIWRLCAYAARRIAHGIGGGRAWMRPIGWAVHGMLYAGVGLPITVFVLGELLISANELLLDEQADYRLQSDFASGHADHTLVLPGPRTPAIAAVPRGNTEEYRQYLVERFAPVVLHKVSAHPEWDVPLALDFDGNDDPRDNVANQARLHPRNAAVYGELTAETEDSYYLTYSFYHVKDYDHPVREFVSNWTYHDNDNDGFHLRVDKDSLQVVEVETWFHNRFLLFNRTGIATGTEPVHGKLHFEDDTHVLIYSQSQGHGVRCAQIVDEKALASHAKVLRLRVGRPVVPISADDVTQVDGTYDLVSFDSWYALATGPFGTKGQGSGMFEETIALGTQDDGTPLVIGRFIAGLDYAKDSWSRPKPPWSWDDGWDDIPILMWHFYPSFAFASHAGSVVSHTYLYNRPVEKTFGVDADELLGRLDLETERRRGNKWRPLQFNGKTAGTAQHKSYWRAAQKVLKRYVNYVFHALG